MGMVRYIIILFLLILFLILLLLGIYVLIVESINAFNIKKTCESVMINTEAYHVPIDKYHYNCCVEEVGMVEGAYVKEEVCKGFTKEAKVK